MRELSHRGLLGARAATFSVMRVDGGTVSAKSELDKEGYEWGLESFLDEARVVAQFDHLNIIRIHRFLEQNGTGYIVMELIEGKSLTRLRKQARLNQHLH